MPEQLPEITSPSGNAAAPSLPVLSLVLALLMPAACVVPPPVDPPSAHVVPALLLLKEKADPSVLVPVVVDRSKLNKTFDVLPEHPGIDALALRYYWYYDYSKTLPSLDQSVVCATAQNRCALFPCSQLAAQDDRHRLTVVVSDLPLRVTDDQAHDPFDFPQGAHFDSLSWDIDLVGACP